MKKLALILLLTLGMTLSFAAIGLVMLFAVGVVQNLDEIQSLMITGEISSDSTGFQKASKINQIQDGLQLLLKQKEELEQDLLQLKDDQGQLKKAKESLSREIKTIQQQSQEGSTNQAQLRQERLQQQVALYNAMRPADAATIFDGMSDDLVLGLLPLLKERQAARILNNLGDDIRKSQIATQLIEGSTNRNQP